VQTIVATIGPNAMYSSNFARQPRSSTSPRLPRHAMRGRTGFSMARLYAAFRHT
jgi:hypothetical protein